MDDTRRHLTVTVSRAFPPGIRLAAAMAAALLAGGCAMQTQDVAARLETDSRLLQPVRFSDEASRSLIRQTQKLLALQTRDYLVGPDDVLEISIFEWEMSEQTKTLEFRVAESGVISLPALGAVPVAGKTIQEIQTSIVEQLAAKNVLQNPRVAVSVKEFRSRRIAVIGAVNAPGVYAIHENVSTLLDVLTLAGGPSDSAGEVAYILRKKTENTEPLKIAVDLSELFTRGNFELNAVLRGDDVVYVPKAPLIYVYGNVKQPGGFSLQRPMQVLEAIALAGGFSARADRSRCLLIRKGADRQTTLTLDIPGVEAGTAPNLYLRDGDVVSVPESSGKAVLSELWEIFRGIFTFTYRLDGGT